MQFIIPAVVGLATLAAAAPTQTLEERSTQICGQWDSVQTGSYTLYQDLWNEASGTGSQCTTYNSLSGNTISWSTKWSWANAPTQVSPSLPPFQHHVSSIPSRGVHIPVFGELTQPR